MRQGSNYILVGSTLTSLIEGIVLLKKGDSVKIIDDPTLNLNLRWFGHISFLERDILIRIGNFFNIQCLKDLTYYMTNQKLNMVIDHKPVILGNELRGNVLELKRKFPNFFTDITIVEDLFSKGHEENLLEQLKVWTSRLFTESTQDSFSELDRLLQDFLSPLLNPKVSKKVSKKFHNFLSLLVHRYFNSGLRPMDEAFIFCWPLFEHFEINFELLAKELRGAFIELGGEIINEKILDWEFDRSQARLLLVDGFRGLLSFDRLHLHGHNETYPFHHPQKGMRTYKSVEGTLKTDRTWLKNYDFFRVIHLSTQQVGTNVPFWEWSVISSDTLKFQCFYFSHEGSKASFYYPKIKQMIFEDLHRQFIVSSREEFEAGLDIREGRERLLGLEGKPFKYPRSVSIQGKTITNISYNGSFNSYGRGLLGHLTGHFSPYL